MRLLFFRLAACLLTLVLAGGAACRGRDGAQDRAGPSGGGLVSPSGRHDFGAVVEGEPLRHAFPIANAGRTPIRIARVERSPACRATGLPVAPLAPAGTATVDIECDSRNRPPKLADAIFVVPDGDGTPLRLELRATIRPLLAFEPALAVLETSPGGSATLTVRMVGAAAEQARPRVVDTGAAAATLAAHSIPASDARGVGVELVLTGRAVGDWSDRVLISTGLERRPEIGLPYVARVKSAIEIDPIKPTFNLRDPDGRSQTLSVKSARPGFRILRAEIVSGPFRAALVGAGVRVSVDAARLPAGQRGVAGKLVIVTNDAAEPRREVQLFAMGAPEPPF